MSNTINDKSNENFEDDDDYYLDFKKDESKFTFLIPYYDFFIEIITSDIAAIFYIITIMIGIIYLFYYIFVNHEILRLSRTKSGYSLVA